MLHLDPPCCPECGEPAQGTLEDLEGLAFLTWKDAQAGVADWNGETKPLWDTQRTQRDQDHRVTLFCPAGHDWQAHMEDRDDDDE